MNSVGDNPLFTNVYEYSCFFRQVTYLVTFAVSTNLALDTFFKTVVRFSLGSAFFPVSRCMSARAVYCAD